jgi:4'-phosphopantetheinyl transferase
MHPSPSFGKLNEMCRMDLLTRCSFAVFRPGMTFEWGAPPHSPQVPRDGNVDLWKAFRRSGEPVRGFELVLSDDEIGRANRFHDPVHRDRFIYSRETLRGVLGSYVGVHPSEVQLTYGRSGKPALANESTLQFNLSHSGELTLIAVSDRAVGVDVELASDVPDLMSVARKTFQSDVLAELDLLSPPQRPRRFFELWTQHEARLKAIGCGFNRIDDATEAETISAWPIEVCESDSRYIAACATRLGR